MSNDDYPFGVDPDRRRLLKRGGALAGLAVAGTLPFRVARTYPATRVATPYGVQAGDVTEERAVIWSYADRPARMWVELADNPGFRQARRLRGPAALPANGLTAKLDVDGLTPGSRVHYRVYFEDLAGDAHASEPLVGSLMTPAAEAPGAFGHRDPIRFVWSGDMVGQGWGINPDIGGIRIFETMRRQQPDFFIHNGDAIYADDPLEQRITLPDGGVWQNIVTDAKRQHAETLAQFRGNFQYNLLDDNLRRFNAEVPVYAQWDDHEVHNNWYPGEVLPDPQYDQKAVNVLEARAHRAFVEYMPVRFGERDRLYRHFSYGPSLDVFRVDLRSFRGPNSRNLQVVQSAATDYLGAEQLGWLKFRLRASRATWKVISSDLPIGLVVADGDNFENDANADDGRPRGRELEIADLLRFIKHHRIRNVVWITTDVHYTAAHHYHPDRAGFKDFSPFWEFVSGPLNAGTFGPNAPDGTFGPDVVFQKAPPDGQANLSPLAGLQFFGQVDIGERGRSLTVTLKDLENKTLFSKRLRAQGRF